MSRWDVQAPSEYRAASRAIRRHRYVSTLILDARRSRCIVVADHLIEVAFKGNRKEFFLWEGGRAAAAARRR